MAETGERPAALELRRVHKAYAEGGTCHQVLEGVSAVIVAGEFIAVVGPSGSGKSTLLNLLAGLDRPDRGQVLIEGRDISGESDRTRTLLRRTGMGFVFQFFNLIEGLTVRENLRLPLELQGVVSAADDERLHALLDRVGLWGRRDSFSDRLSGGERQRVALLRALVHRPRIVFADEPTGNLDEVASRGALTLMRELVTDFAATLVMVTHSMSAAGYADRVLSLNAGRLESSEEASGSSERPV